MNRPDETQKMVIMWTVWCGWWVALIGGFMLYAAFSEPRGLGGLISWVAIGIFFLAIGIGPFIWMRMR
jgi:hypothetical protein